MAGWKDRRILDLFGIELPIIQAPMAGAAFADMAIAVAEAGGLGSLACATLSSTQVREELEKIRKATSKPVNLNFFCHQTPAVDAEREARWRKRLEQYYLQLGLDPQTTVPVSERAPFNTTSCELVEHLRPEVVSFHFGLPEASLLKRVKTTGAKVIASATCVEEAVWLEAQGCDAIIAQGYEAGGHRGMFITGETLTQVGTMSLVPQVVDAVEIPVIAAGGICDSRGIVAAFALGAAAVQLGTAYLFCPEAKVAPVHLERLRHAKDNETVITNVFTGRPARSIVNRLVIEIGPMSADAPEFPLAANALAPLRASADPATSGDFVTLWAGQSSPLGREMPAGELTRLLAAETLARS